jgi:hypothetical protein
MAKNSLIIIVMAAMVGGGAFFGGMKYQQSKQPRGFRQFANGGTNVQNRNLNFRPVTGEIISSDDKSITVKLADGSSKIVLLTDNTSYNKASEASKTDLKTGEKVMVSGAQNSDGSVTAQFVELNPIIRNQADPSGQ